MTDRIIVAFDGSELAREAFAYAAMCAHAGNYSIHAFHAIEPGPPPGLLVDPMLGFDAGPAINADEQRIIAERERITRDFAELQHECDQRDIGYTQSIVNGNFLAHLTDEAFPTDLVAVGRKGRFAKSGFGSTTTALINQSPCPVMVVSGPMRPLVRLLAVYDNTPQAKRALTWAHAQALRMSWPLTILACAGQGYTLDHALDRATQHCPDASIISMSEEEQKNEGTLIEHAAQKAGYALLVLGAYPDAWWHRLFFEGTTEHVLANVAAPIVLVH